MLSIKTIITLPKIDKLISARTITHTTSTKLIMVVINSHDSISSTRRPDELMNAKDIMNTKNV